MNKVTKKEIYSEMKTIIEMLEEAKNTPTPINRLEKEIDESLDLLLYTINHPTINFNVDNCIYKKMKTRINKAIKHLENSNGYYNLPKL